MSISEEQLNPLETTVKPQKKYSSSRIRDHLTNERTYLAWMVTIHPKILHLEN